MIRTRHTVFKTRSLVALFCMLLGLSAAHAARAATIFFQTGAPPGGSTTYAPSTPISGTMSAAVPRFNGGLGTLIQADFEFASSAGGSLTSNSNVVGTSTLNYSGPADVGGQGMGNLAIGFVGTYNDAGPSNEFNANSVSAMFNTGAFFLSLTGVGTVTMTYNYSGNVTMSTPATGGYMWGGSVHVLYTYVPVPEPSTLALGAIGLCAAPLVARKRRLRVH